MTIAQIQEMMNEHKDGAEPTRPVTNLMLNLRPPRRQQSQRGYGDQPRRNEVFVICYLHCSHREH